MNYVFCGKKIFTVVTILSEARLRISQKLRRISSIKLNLVFLDCTCLRVFFCVEKSKIDAIVTNLPWLNGFLWVFFTYVFELFCQIDCI